MCKTEFPLHWPHRVMAAGFHDWEDFEGAILASSTLPFVIGTPFFLGWRGRRCLDGGLVDNCPLFRDQQRHQLVVDLHKLKTSSSEMHLLPDRARLRCVPPSACTSPSSTWARTQISRLDDGFVVLTCRHYCRDLWRAGQEDCASLLRAAFCGEQQHSSGADQAAPMQLLAPGSTSIESKGEVDASARTWLRKVADGVLLCFEIPPILALLFCARYGPTVPLL